jgi:hypothetical protein
LHFKYLMQQVYQLPIHFTFDQVIEFGNITGDNGPVHSIDGIVQGGFILSMLPRWMITVMDNNNIQRAPVAVSMMLDVKFRNKLKSGHDATVSFEFESTNKTLSKVKWSVFCPKFEYCSGKWVIHKS